MKLIVGLLFTFSVLYSSSDRPNDCALENFVGVWKGKVVHDGEEISQGPYTFSIGDDGTSLVLTDETGASYQLIVSGCDAVNLVEEEGMTMKTTYTYTEGALQILSEIEFPDAEGKMYKTEMKGSMSKVE